MSWGNKPRTECTHDTLHFGSGDYYIFCNDCGGKWCAHGALPEYGQDANGKNVGADPTVCVQPGMLLSGHERRKPPELIWYQNCEAHKGMTSTFRMTTTTFGMPKSVCPICHPPK